MDQATGTTFDQHEPSLLISKQPLPLKYLQTAGATSGQVVKYNGTTAVWGDETVSPGEVALTDAHVLVGNASNVAADVAMSGDITISNAGVTAIGASKVTKTMLAAGVKASHMIVFAGQPTTVGGAAAEAITVTGALATDLAFVQMVNDGTNNVTIVNAVVTNNTLTVTFSADPGNDAVINYQIVRATS